MFEMEKRGYVKAGPWTPEATVENPEVKHICALACKENLEFACKVSFNDQ